MNFWENQTTDPFVICLQCYCPYKGFHFWNCPYLYELRESVKAWATKSKRKKRGPQ